MWQKLFSAPWPDADNLLPASVQQQAEQQIRSYWIRWGWQFVLGEVVLWAIITYQEIAHAWVYGALAVLIGLGYLLGIPSSFASIMRLFTRGEAHAVPAEQLADRPLTIMWLVGNLGLLLAQGMLISGLGAVTALSFLMQYNFAGMLLSGKDRVFVQVCCVVAFWVSLIYEAYPRFPQLVPPRYIVVSYNILLAVYIFQTLRFLNHLAIEINTAHVADQVQQRSQHFLARVSHELRTPLNSVLGFAKLLRRADLPDTQQRYLQQIVEESTHLNRLVSDLLDSAHLSTGKLTLNLERCDLNALCQAVVEEHQTAVPADVQLKLTLAPELPMITGDPVRLRQAVGNLVSNAIKYTSRGEIHLRTYKQGDSIAVEIKDTGVGISDNDQKLIFVPFVQLDNRRIGVGLGLDIALQLIRLHGGSIHVQSTPGQGSTFAIYLPVGR